MDYKNLTTEWNKTAIFTAQTYGTKTTVEIDHSDLSLDEVMDAFQTLINGMGYHHDGFKEWVLERAAEYQEEEDEKWDDIKASMEQDEQRYENLRHSTDEAEKRMDIIGQNGNDGLHYSSDNFEDYQNQNNEDDEQLKINSKKKNKK